MGTPRWILIPNGNNLKASSAVGDVGTIDLPARYTYLKIRVDYIDGGSTPIDIGSYAALVTPANQIIGDVVLYRNGTPLRTHTAAQLDYLNLINGSQYARSSVSPGGTPGATTRQSLHIFLWEPWRKDKADTFIGAWPVSPDFGFDTFQLKLTCAYAIPATASFQVWALVDDLPPKGDNVFQFPGKKVYRQSLNSGGTVTDADTFLAKRDLYESICIMNPTGGSTYVSYVTIRKNGVPILDRVSQFSNIAELAASTMNVTVTNTPQTAGLFGFPVVFDAIDPVGSSLPVPPGTDLNVKIEYAGTASGNTLLLVERFGPLDA